MKPLLNLPISIKILIAVLISGSGLIAAFNWPQKQSNTPFTNPVEIKPLATAGNLNHIIENENARIDEAKKQEDEAAAAKVAAAKAAADAKAKAARAAAAQFYSGAHIRFGYLYSASGDYISQIGATGGGVNMISPGWFTTNADGSISDRHDTDLVNYAHGNGISVVPFINGNAGTLLQNPASRSKLANDIYTKVVNYGVEGINIDFEGTDITKDNLNSFMQELTNRLHASNKISTIAVTAKLSDSQTWLNRFDYRYLGSVVDLVVVMAYDEHYRGGSVGPISSIGWYKQVAVYAANTIPRNKVIMGLPFYGRHWINGGGGSGVDYNYITKTLLAPANAPILWHPTYNVPYAQYNDSSLHEIYFENAQSIQLKANEINSGGFRGAAFWRLGQEDPAVWPVIRNTIK